MSNSRTKKESHSYASIDEAPVADGYWCEEVSMNKNKTNKLYWSRRGAGVGTVTIQFRCPGDSAWTDYVTDEGLASGERFIIDDNAAGVRWRTGIKEDTSADNTYTSGTITVGLDWY